MANTYNIPSTSTSTGSFVRTVQNFLLKCIGVATPFFSGAGSTGGKYHTCMRTVQYTYRIVQGHMYLSTVQGHMYLSTVCIAR